MTETHQRCGRAILAMILLAGCGSPVVEPGPTLQLPPAGTRNAHPPASPPSDVPATDAPAPRPSAEPLRLPAASVVDLPPQNAEARYHEVRAGETLFGIARQYGLPAERLRDANGLEPSPVLQPGQLLYVPR